MVWYEASKILEFASDISNWFIFDNLSSPLAGDL